MCGRWQTLTLPHSRSTRLIASMNIYYWNIHQDSKIDKMSPYTHYPGVPRTIAWQDCKKGFCHTWLQCWRVLWGVSSKDVNSDLSILQCSFHLIRNTKTVDFQGMGYYFVEFCALYGYGDVLALLGRYRASGIRECKQHWQSLDDFSHWRHSENWEISSMDWTICTSTSSSPIPGDPPTHPPCPQYEIK